jgi:hypothetical protein
VRRLEDELYRAAVGNMSGWQLYGAAAVSVDGQTIVGYGINPQGQPAAWMARLP